MKPRIAIFFGTRPEALKLAPVIAALRKEPRFSLQTILTAQHREMIDQVLGLFRIPVDEDLDLMTENQTLAALSQRLLSRIDDVFRRLQPDLVMVQGDTTTAMIVSLSAFYHRIPLAHVEAGLRTQNKYHPFPEEINRRLITRLADYHFPPTKIAEENLLKEGIPRRCIKVTGNTVIDSLMWVKNRLRRFYPRFEKINFSKRMILLTAHRRESIGPPLVRIGRAISQLVNEFPDLEVVFPIHLNPNVQKIVRQNLDRTPRIHLLPPLPYDEMVFLMQKAYLILTDSGGIQEEAPSLGKPVLVLREVSERPEGIRAGALKVVGTGTQAIVKAAAQLLSSPSVYRRMARIRHIYGDGKASGRIVSQLKSWLL